MNNPNDDYLDSTVILLGLCLLDALLPKSNYPEEVKSALAKRVRALTEDIQRDRTYDAYGNPHEPFRKPWR